MSAWASSRKRTRVTATSVRSLPCSRIAMPPITSCQRPDSSCSQASASAASAGLPWARSSHTTMLSTARTSSPGTARSLSSAFWTTSSRGSPSVSSSTSGASTEKSTPSCSRIARLRGELEARIRRSGAKLREEQAGLARGRFGRVRAVDQVGLHLEAEVTADRPGRRLDRVRRADHLASGLDGLVPLQDERHERAAGDELHELPEERPLCVLGVVLLGEVTLDGHVLHGGDPQALALKAVDDLAREPALECVRLHQDQGPVHLILLLGLALKGRPAGFSPRSADGHGSREPAARRRRPAGPGAPAAPALPPPLASGAAGDPPPPGPPRPRSKGRSSSAGRAACRRPCMAP